MKILQDIRTLKQAVKEETQTFATLLEKAQEVVLEEREEILTHFTSIHIKEKNELIHLKYNVGLMHKRPWDYFYQQTRGLIIDWKKEEVVCYPFDKFFELDEHKTTRLSVVKEKAKQTSEYEITEKIDGSLIIARYYHDDFLVASSGNLEGPHVEIAKSILDQNISLEQFMKDHSDYTVILEMKNTQYPQLIKYAENTLTIIGMRDMRNFQLLTRKQVMELARDYQVDVVKTVTLALDEMLDIMNDPNTSNNEGYILRIDDLMVKMKTKNFILANRFAGEGSRNFNMVVEAINEGRIKAIRPMIAVDYLPSFDLMVEVIENYAKEKEEKIRNIVENFPTTITNGELAKEAQKIGFSDVKLLIAMKENRYVRLSKDDIKFLKKYQDFFTCISHIKYAQQEELSESEVEEKLENGEIHYLKKYENTYSGRVIYIIHKWQWLNREEITY